MSRSVVRAVSVLEASPPRFAPDEDAAIAAEHFALDGTAVERGSERDQTFLIDDGESGGGSRAQWKPSGPATVAR